MISEASLPKGEILAAKPEIDFEFSFKVIEAWRAIAAAEKKLCFTTFVDCVLPEARCRATFQN
jgi:hypothetical protein